MKFIAAVVAENGSGPNVNKVFAEGIHVGGQRYVAFNIEGRHIYGRQVRLSLHPPPAPPQVSACSCFANAFLFSTKNRARLVSSSSRRHRPSSSPTTARTTLPATRHRPLRRSPTTSSSPDTKSLVGVGSGSGGKRLLDVLRITDEKGR